MLTSYQFDYANGSRCNFHEEIGTQYCALGYTKRYAYLISDSLCPLFDVELIEGKHLPIEVSACTVVQISTEYRSLGKKQRFGDKNRHYDDDSILRPPVDIRYSNSTPSIQPSISGLTSNSNRSSTATNFSKITSQASFQRTKVADKLMSNGNQANSIASNKQIRLEQQSAMSSNFDDTNSERFAERSDNGFVHDDDIDDDDGFQTVIPRKDIGRGRLIFGKR